MFVGIAGVEGIAVGAEVGYEVGGKFVGDEFRAQRSLGGELGRGVGGLVFEQTQQGVGVGGDGGLDGGGGVAEVGIREGGIVEFDGAGGAGDVLEVGGEGVDEDGLANGRAELADARVREREASFLYA